MMNMIPITISILALASSVYIGYRQIKIDELQSKMQDKVELYLLVQPITLIDAMKKNPEQVLPAIYIRNIGRNVIYLKDYCFNGINHSLGKEVLPPVSMYDGYRYIFLPIDHSINYISLAINFYDWKGGEWVTNGFANFHDGTWELTYNPAEKIELR